MSSWFRSRFAAGLRLSLVALLVLPVALRAALSDSRFARSTRTPHELAGLFFTYERIYIILCYYRTGAILRTGVILRTCVILRTGIIQ